MQITETTTYTINVTPTELHLLTDKLTAGRDMTLSPAHQSVTNEFVRAVEQSGLLDRYPSREDVPDSSVRATRTRTMPDTGR